MLAQRLDRGEGGFEIDGGQHYSNDGKRVTEGNKKDVS